MTFRRRRVKIEEATDFTIIKQLFALTSPCGYPEAAIAAAVQKFGALPQVLRAYYQELGAEQDLNQTQDKLMGPTQLTLSGDYVIFYRENQDACVWAIAQPDLMQSNPPVYASYDRQKWLVEAAHLSDFLRAMAQLQAVFALPYGLDDFLSFTEAQAEQVRISFQGKNPGFTAWLNISFYGDEPDSIIALIQNTGYYDVVYASGSESHYVQLDHKLSLIGKGE